MSNEKVKNEGLTNKVALAVIAIGYPLGMIGCSLAYVSSVKDTFWNDSSQLHAENEAFLDEKRARKLIKEWWNIRASVYGSPYDREAAKKVVAKGPLWKSLDSSKSPIRWLKENGREQEFRGQIQKVISFDPEVEKPKMVADIESVTRITGGSSNLAKEKISVKTHEIVFFYEDGTWKIWSYKALK